MTSVSVTPHAVTRASLTSTYGESLFFTLVRNVVEDRLLQFFVGINELLWFQKSVLCWNDAKPVGWA